MRSLCLLLLALAQLAACAPLVQDSASTTNVCGLKYNYCPRDPGCKTYTMSVHNVIVHDDNSTAPIKVEDIKIGSTLELTITGNTTIETVYQSGSYRIYALQGGNVASGVLADVLTLDGAGGFSVTASFPVTTDLYGSSTDKTLFEFGLDIFQQASGSDEGMCVEVSSDAYVAEEQSKSSPPFEMLCKDDGNGHFELLATPLPMPTFDVSAPACAPKPPPPPPPTPAGCALDWYYCPRDPGCVTYTMSVSNVSFDTTDPKGYTVGDKVTVVADGTTNLKEVPAGGSYRIYMLSGKNGASGVLTDVLTLTSAGHFQLKIPFTVQAGFFSGSFFEFGIDVFQGASGSDEGMCIEVANPAYVANQQAKPAPAFNMDCIDQGGGHFESKLPDGVPEKVSTVTCVIQK